MLIVCQKTRNLLLKIVLLGLITLSVTVMADTDVTEVIHPPAQSEFDTRTNDFVEILKTALEKTEATDGPFILRATTLDMNPLRFQYEMKNGHEPNIIWSSATQEQENDFLPIKIPLRKGILGYRIFLINKSDQNKFLSISSTDELKKLFVGQGVTWLDTAILRENGFRVITGSNYEGLFKMLISHRFDFLPRGINEAYTELNKRYTQYPDMIIEKSILLYYPLPQFFFVNKDNKKLANRIERGMNIMIQDGTFNEIFMKYNKNYINILKSTNRKIFKIENPFLPKDMPYDRKELWYDLFKQDD